MGACTSSPKAGTTVPPVPDRDSKKPEASQKGAPVDALAESDDMVRRRINELSLLSIAR